MSQKGRVRETGVQSFSLRRRLWQLRDGRDLSLDLFGLSFFIDSSIVSLGNFPMIIRVIAFLLFLAPVILDQQPTPILSDPKLTPGDSFSVTVQDLCVTGYTKKVRNVPPKMKRQVYEEYGVKSYGSGDYEVDHLIPLELGGSNSIKNSGET
jgi:hypothetical protein